jgi:moderate conductance mechanosensitive channel
MPTRSQMLSLDTYLPLLFSLVRIGFILLFAYLCTLAAGRLLRGLRTYAVKTMLKSGGVPEYEIEKRAHTVDGVVRRVMSVLIWAIAGIMILFEMHFDIRPLLAGAGVAGVAIGFGAQSVVKDVLNGLFLLMENQLRVNDVAVINDKSGVVEEINLRTTVLRGEDGAVHIFPNGGIQSIANLTREYSYYVFNLSVAYQADTDRVSAVLKEIADQLMREELFQAAILAPLEVMGVDRLGDVGVLIKARFKTLPGQQWLVGREMNRRIKKRFQEAEIERAFPAQTTIQLSTELRNELRQVVREVLQEHAEPKPEAGL